MNLTEVIKTKFRNLCKNSYGKEVELNKKNARLCNAMTGDINFIRYSSLLDIINQPENKMRYMELYSFYKFVKNSFNFCRDSYVYSHRSMFNGINYNYHKFCFNEKSIMFAEVCVDENIYGKWGTFNSNGSLSFDFKNLVKASMFLSESDVCVFFNGRSVALSLNDGEHRISIITFDISCLFDESNDSSFQVMYDLFREGGYIEELDPLELIEKFKSSEEVHGIEYHSFLSR